MMMVMIMVMVVMTSDDGVHDVHDAVIIIIMRINE
jgi:hypothetical protein